VSWNAGFLTANQGCTRPGRLVGFVMLTALLCRPVVLWPRG